jgi:hypothetical protein
MPYVRGFFAIDGIYVAESDDDGWTWNKPRRLVLPISYHVHTGKTGIIELPGGSWLLPFGGRNETDQVGKNFVVKSRDKGWTWGEQAVMADPYEFVKAETGKVEPSNVHFTEPALLRLPSGKIIGMHRSGGMDDHLYQSESFDDGETWTPARRTPMWGKPAHMIRLRSGRIFCVYSYRRQPFGIRGVYSDDDGETWDYERETVLRKDGLDVDLGYPASVQLEDDKILTIYWFHHEDGVRYIAGTIHEEE